MVHLAGFRGAGPITTGLVTGSEGRRVMGRQGQVGREAVAAIVGQRSLVGCGDGDASAGLVAGGWCDPRVQRGSQAARRAGAGVRGAQGGSERGGGSGGEREAAGGAGVGRESASAGGG